MYRIFVLGIMGASLCFAQAQGVLVGTSGQQPDPSATFEIRSNQGGFLLPRLTTTQRNAIANPAIGLQIYNVSTNCVDLFFNTGWRPVSCACTSSPSPSFTVMPAVPSTGSPTSFTALQSGNVNFQWSFQNGTPASASGNAVQSQWANAGNYNVTLVATDSAGCMDSLTQTLTITNCSSGSVTFNHTGNVQTWTVPTAACNVTILAEGGQGGNGQQSGNGGLGASIQGTFSNLSPGTVLNIVVGGQGISGLPGNSSRGGGGGGGSFVYTNANQLLVAAGGGGGGGHTSNGHGGHGLTGNSGGASNYGNAGGSNGSGGTVTTSNGYDGGGGAGWLSDGASNTYASGGRTRTNNWTGGTANAYSPTGVNGGYGGGGGAEHGAGGGGGYSGGGSGRNGSPYGAGGGGSFNGGSNPVNQSGVRNGHGRVVITWN